jgi:hypothetical protein
MTTMPACEVQHKCHLIYDVKIGIATDLSKTFQVYEGNILGTRKKKSRPRKIFWSVNNLGVIVAGILNLHIKCHEVYSRAVSLIRW